MSENKTSSPLNESRRAEILAAATKAFREKGFHAASMSEIARSFGMSTSHIYNYFENKEAIVMAIQERLTAEATSLMNKCLAGRQQKTDPEETSKIKHEAFERLLNDDEYILCTEILAEATRNEKVKLTLEESDTKLRERLMQLYEIDEKDQESKARLEVAMAIWDGIGARRIRHPDLDKEMVLKVVTETNRFLFNRPGREFLL